MLISPKQEEMMVEHCELHIAIAKRLWLFGLLSLCLGCGPEGPEIADVRGVVRLDSKPLPGALVTFQPTGSGTYSSAFTDQDGNYKLILSRSQTGAYVGSHTVTIYTAPPSIGGVERVPAKYNSKSELTREVTSGGNTIDFDLDSAATKNKSPTKSK